MAYLNVVKVHEALEQMKEKFLSFEKEEAVALNTCVGRYLAKDYLAPENLPDFRRSMVDGYAVKSENVFGASEQSPMLLENIGLVEMGKPANQVLEGGKAIYVPTGGEIPKGADAMVMIEHTETMGPDIAIFSTPRKGQYIVEVGEDVKSGQNILLKGQLIGAHHMGLMASLGISRVRVYQRPKISILSTGDELVAINEKPAYGQVRDCNRQIIESVLTACGCDVVFSSHCRDDFESLKEVIKTCLSKSDMVILSGGSSAGTKDMTQGVIDDLSENKEKPNVFIHGLAIKPGKPTLVACVNEKPVIGLPGHPAACFMTLKALVEPFIHSWLDVQENKVTRVPCVSQFQLYAASGRDVYQLVKLDHHENKDGLIAHIIYGKSGMVSALAEANAYVVVPMAKEGVSKGDMLTAYLL